MSQFRVNTRTVICLVCRKSGNGLPCAHRKLVCRDARVPRLSAGRYRWMAFLEWLNDRVGAGAVYWADDGSRVTGRLSFESGAIAPEDSKPPTPQRGAA